MQRALAGYLDAIPEAERPDLHGLIFAAACDFSKASREVFREKARTLGFSEAYLWGKAELEDFLFEPKNDHLLFAYFGISLQARRRSIGTDVRARLTAKRKVNRLATDHRYVLVRDATDERYPYLDQDRNKHRNARGRWQVYEFEGCKSDGGHLKFSRHFAYIDSDGTGWDYAERMNAATPSRHEDPWTDERHGPDAEQTAAYDIWQALPENNKAWFELFFILPYERIIDIDDVSDEFFKGPQILVDAFTAEGGPFRDYVRLLLEPMSRWSGISATPDEETRVERFPRKDPAQQPTQKPKAKPRKK
jgi:hypothetical protein